MNRPRLLIADDHVLLLDAFRKLLEREYDVVGTVSDGMALVDAAESLKPDLVLADIAMPRLNGLEAASRLLERNPELRLIFLTVNQDPDVASEAIRRGASGFLLKTATSDELFAAIRQVLQGELYVTPSVRTPPPASATPNTRRGDGSRELSARQREVLELLAQGRSMKEAAAALGVTPRTIAFHKYTIMQLVGATNSAQLIQYAIRSGIAASHLDS